MYNLTHGVGCQTEICIRIDGDQQIYVSDFAVYHTQSQHFAQIAVALNDCGRPGNVWKLGFWWILWRCAETAEQMKHFWNGNTFCYRVEASKVRVTLSPLIIRIPQTLEQLFLAFSSYRRCCQQTMRLLKLLMTRSVPIRSRHFVYTITEGNPQACPFRPINKTIATKMRDAVFGTDLHPCTKFQPNLIEQFQKRCVPISQTDR